MKISRNIFLICISLLTLFMPGCCMSEYGKGGKLYMELQEYQGLMPFSPGFDKALYKARLEVGDRGFDGLMMIKAFDDGSYKVAFFSELGLNFFDFELRNINKENHLNLYVRNIYSPLDRDILLNKFEKYFSMLLGPGPAGGTRKTFLKEEGAAVMIMMDAYKGRDAYVSTNLVEPYSEIVNFGGLFGRERINITLTPESSGHCPAHILIEQPGFGLKFRLDIIE